MSGKKPKLLFGRFRLFLCMSISVWIMTMVKTPLKSYNHIFKQNEAYTLLFSPFFCNLASPKTGYENQLFIVYPIIVLLY